MLEMYKICHSGVLNGQDSLLGWTYEIIRRISHKIYTNLPELHRNWVYMGKKILDDGEFSLALENY